ncbi:MAG: MATE family efflux transporter [Hyphomicrobiales bacterium]|nr:MAG: MATE family efflux transporter [Hyphomicrobiales bacterium]
MPQNMTFENFGHKQILTIAIPVILSNITTPLVGLTDMAVIGHAQLSDGISSAAATGAVAFGGMIFGLIFGSLSFFRMGTSGFTAQAKGAGDKTELAAIFLRVLLVGFAIGVAIILLRQPVIDIMFYWSDASADVQRLSSEYYQIRALAAPFTLMNYVILGWLMGQGRAKLGLLIQLVLNISNIVLNLYFVFVLNLAVAGVAWASALAELIAFTISITIILAIYKPQFFKIPRVEFLDRAKLLRMFNVNRDILIRSMALLASLTWFTLQSGNMGDTLLAANAILLQFLVLFAYILDGFATSSEVFIGQSVGAKNNKIFDRVFKLSLGWAFAMAAFLVVLTLLFGEQLVNFLSQDAEVRSAAMDYLFWPAIAIIIGAWCYTVDGVFLGATRGADMRNMMLISLAVYFISWFILVELFGNHGHWAAYAIMLFTRGITLHSRIPKLKAEAF